MLDARELLEYKRTLEGEANADNPAGYVFYNDSILHAMIVMKNIFDNAKKNNKDVMMYCGKFSLFRNETEAKINDAINFYNVNDNDIEAWDNLDLYQDLQTSLRKFVDSNNKLDIIIEHDAETLKENNVWNVLSNGINKGNVRIYSLLYNIGLNHFVTTSNSYRVENSNVAKTAVCCFNDPKSGGLLKDNFKALLKMSCQLNIS